VQVGTPEAGRYKVVLTSDDVEFGGQGRLSHATEHFTHPEGTPGLSPSLPQASKGCNTGVAQDMKFADMSAPDKVRLETTLTVLQVLRRRISTTGPSPCWWLRPHASSLFTQRCRKKSRSNELQQKRRDYMETIWLLHMQSN